MSQDYREPIATPSQIALPLVSHVPRGPQRLVVGNANAHVIEAVLDPTTWPFHVAVLAGPARSGKSLIGRWLAGQSTPIPIEVIDNAESMDETELFHRWNAVQDGGIRHGEALLLIVNPVGNDGKGWSVTLPDLASRIGGSLQLEITEPDDVMAGALIAALAEQRGLNLPEGASDYLVPRAERSFAALEALVRTIDRISLERQSAATMSVWRAALEALQGPEQQRLF